MAKGQALNIGLMVLGLVLLGLAFTAPNLLAILTVNASTVPPNFYYKSPQGTSTLPQILAIGSMVQFLVVVGDQTSLLTAPSTVELYARTGSSATAAITGTYLFDFVWTAGVVTRSVCSVSTCTPEFDFSIACNSPTFCGMFIVSLVIPNTRGSWIYFYGIATDVSGLVGTTDNLTSYSVIDIATGFFIINGQPITPTSNIVSNTNNIAFRYNATNAPQSVAYVQLTVANISQTGIPTKTICVWGVGGNSPGTACLQQVAQPSPSTPFVVFPIQNIYFNNGQYNITGTFTCTTCTVSTVRVLSIIGGYINGNPISSFTGISPTLLVQISLGVVGAVLVGGGYYMMKGGRRRFE